MENEPRSTEQTPKINLYFSDIFGVSEDVLQSYGAFNISLVTDLPLFIDPFLLFNSEKPHYRELHEQMIVYLRFLRDKSMTGVIHPALVSSWYSFPEVKENWLGFCETGNTGHGLGINFANALNRGLSEIFLDFGNETITRGSHIEKLGLFRERVGRDMISDFTTNLIKRYLLTFTQEFATYHIESPMRRAVSVDKVHFSYKYERWYPETYELPIYRGKYVLLTPVDILTKDDTWINRADFAHRFSEIPDAIENTQLREEVNNYFRLALAEFESRDKKASQEEYGRAVAVTLSRYPVLADYYIKLKEDSGEDAIAVSASKVRESHALYIAQFGTLVQSLRKLTGFFEKSGNTRDEALEKVRHLKDIVENGGGHRWFWVDGRAVRRETDLHILYRLAWFGTESDVSCEVNDGRGPADFKISRGSKDKTIVEFKLASNSKLKNNLQKQVEIYKKASHAENGIKVIFYFSKSELERVEEILDERGLTGSEDIVLVDARNDNKPSASNA